MIGVIADDMTGATDVAAALRRAGLQTVLSLTAEVGEQARDADAIVIGLKTRSIPVADAVEQSLAALESLRGFGATLHYLKYCSTFDSTADGNIGPVVEALADELGVGLVVTTPAAPLHGRTVYRGHLFVGDVLLNETHMREHPITPMRDSSILRLLAPQVRGSVGLVPLETVREGAGAIRAAVASEAAKGTAHLVIDAVAEQDLAAVAEVVEGATLLAGSAGLIGALALRRGDAAATAAEPPMGRTAIIAGSCSHRTLEQVAQFRDSGQPARQLRAEPGQRPTDLASSALSWFDEQPEDASVLIYSSSPAEERDDRVPDAGELYEQAAGLIAVGLADRGLRRMLIAGGETSGAVVNALGTQTAVVGQEVAPGAPWIHDEEADVHLVLKSGNFGAADLFLDVAKSGETR